MGARTQIDMSHTDRHKNAKETGKHNDCLASVILVVHAYFRACTYPTVLQALTIFR